MRIKTVLCAAALLAAGAATSMAQNVYSLNVVGYVNATVVSPGYTPLNNPFKLTDNSLTNVVDPADAIPVGTRLLTFTNGTYTTVAKGASQSWGTSGAANTTQIPNGKGYYLRNLSGSPFTVTFVGEVPQGALSNTFISASGYSFVGSMVPAATFVGSLGVQPGTGDRILRFGLNGSQTYTTYSWSGTAWSGGTGTNATDTALGPPVNVGEGFFYRNLSGLGKMTINYTLPQ